MDGKIKLDIFGKEIDINPLGYVVSINKVNENLVHLIVTEQSGRIYTNPIDTMVEFQKKADEFISEFNKQTYYAEKDFLGKKSNTVIDVVYEITEKGILYMNENPPQDSATFLLSRAELGKNHIQSQSLVKEIEFLLQNELIKPVK